jgi:peptidoglycan/LPS O-acetylase OafA/YrhL
VFFGGISFPVYLIHSMLMRSVLVWVVVGFIPDGPWPLRYVLMTASFAAYFAMVVFLSILWRDIIDPACATITAYIEAVMVGTKTFGGLFSAVQNWRGPNGIANGVLENGVKAANGSALV